MSFLRPISMLSASARAWGGAFVNVNLIMYAAKGTSTGSVPTSNMSDSGLLYWSDLSSATVVGTSIGLAAQ